MLLLDYSQTCIAAVMQQLNGSQKMKLEEGLIRHIVLNSIRSYLKQFKSKYGDVVICCDSRKYWRRDIFPFYKSHRKKDREKSEYDWALIFDTLAKIREELKEYFPYRVVEVEGAEADDIIAVLAAKYSAFEPVLIISSDRDFIQLQKYKNVQQYSPILKRFIRSEDPQQYVKEHILKGDRGDGIPNFLSPDNVFALGERQKSINTKKLQEWMSVSPESFCVTTEMTRGYKRNQMLIDFDYIPEKIQKTIAENYESIKPATKAKLLNYFIENRLRNLIEVCDEFWTI